MCRSTRLPLVLPLIAACAQSPENIQPQYRGDLYDEGIDCVKLEQALGTNETALVQAVDHQRDVRTADGVNIAAGIYLGMISLLLIAGGGLTAVPDFDLRIGDGDVADYLARLMGERNELISIATEKQCEFDAPTTIDIVGEPDIYEPTEMDFPEGH